MPDFVAIASTFATVLGSLVTAVATVFLWRVTRALAVETKRMAEATARPQVVATIEPNRLSMMHADIVVSNTGNATAFDIVVSFDPPLKRDKDRPDRPIPLQRISLLKPGQELGSFLSEFGPLMEQGTYSVTVAWALSPSSMDRETITLQLDLKELEGITRLGTDPMTQLAKSTKSLDEAFSKVASGWSKLNVNVITSADRAREQEVIRQRYEEFESPAQSAGASSSPEDKPKAKKPPARRKSPPRA